MLEMVTKGSEAGDVNLSGSLTRQVYILLISNQFVETLLTPASDWSRMR
jgi:hypothetical protein